MKRRGGGAAFADRAHKREGVTSRLPCLCAGNLADVSSSGAGSQ